jgi:hypothetical protein
MLMHKGYVNYDVFKKEWSCHIEFMGIQTESQTFKNKSDMQDYVDKNSHVWWMYPEEIGKMVY